MGELDRHLLAPARLKLATMLTAVSEVEFAVLRYGLGVSDSVLSKHVATLGDAGAVGSRQGRHGVGGREPRGGGGPAAEREDPRLKAERRSVS